MIGVVWPESKQLSSRVPADDETAKRVLRQFFEAVLEADGTGELRRIYHSFYLQFHGEHPPAPADWSDKTPDGTLNNNGGLKAQTAVNGS